MFFMPLMIYWLTADSVYLVRAVATPGAIGFYDLALTALIVTDLLFFTVGYGVEHPRLGNEIRSVEPTVLGWVAALVCYPPFQAYTMRALGWYPVEHPPAALPSVQVAAGCLMLALMGIYTWASVSLGLKASNLTNRGTVTHGPYAYVRHPAYIGKNLFWWVGCVPVFVDRAAAGDWVTFALIGLSLSAWSGIYVVRALTEERHLLRDPEYREYCERVRYRFIPGVW
jgi:protein-S-isoprenylcysteine O-methyltransferase Ste14